MELIRHSGERRVIVLCSFIMYLQYLPTRDCCGSFTQPRVIEGQNARYEIALPGALTVSRFFFF